MPSAAFAWTDTTPPMVSSAVVDGTKLTVEFGEMMQGTFDPDDWTWALNGVDQGHPHLVMWVGGLGRATLTLSPGVVGGQQVTLSYTPGDGSLLRDAAGNQLAAFTAHPVRNDSPQPVIVATLNVDDATEETRQLADGDNQEPPTFSDPPDGRAEAQGQQSRFAEPETQPDSEPLLDGERDNPDSTSIGGKTHDHAQSFTTGENRWGYAITSVSFDICFHLQATEPGANFRNDWNQRCSPRPADAPDDPTYEISLWTAKLVPRVGDEPGYYVPDTQVATFDKDNDEPLVSTPGVPSKRLSGFVVPDTDHNSFTASGGPVLVDPDTAYVIVFDFTSTDGASPGLVRTGEDRNASRLTNYGFFIQTATHLKCQYRPVATRRDCDPGDLAPFGRWHAHLTRDSSAQGNGGWTYGRAKYRIQIDGYEIRPQTLRGLGDGWTQKGSQVPGGCGGTPMPHLSRADINAGLHYYCHEPSGTWGLGRWPKAGVDYAREDQLQHPSVGDCGTAAGSSWDPIRKVCVHHPPNQCSIARPENCPNRNEP